MSAISLSTEPLRLSAEGVWYQGGIEVTHDSTIQNYFRNMEFRDGQYYYSGEGSPVPIVVEDTAYFVLEASRVGDGYELKLTDGTTETLDPSTLDNSPEERLYCRIKTGTQRARFERRAYLELTRDWHGRDGFLGLTIAGTFYPLKREEPIRSIEKNLTPATEPAKPLPIRKPAPAPVKAKPQAARKTETKPKAVAKPKVEAKTTPRRAKKSPAKAKHAAPRSKRTAVRTKAKRKAVRGNIRGAGRKPAKAARQARVKVGRPRLKAQRSKKTLRHVSARRRR